ncbi:MAG: hypothetical protein AAFO95_04285 [Cyanobacteria bacterium J06600_6]
MRKISPSLIMALRKATGLGVLEAKQFILENPEQLINRILLAYENKQQRIKQGFEARPHLYDPIEDNERYSDIIKKAKMRVSEIIKEENQQRFLELATQDFVYKKSSSIRHSRKLKQYLWKHHQIEWFSCHEMNPAWIIE